MEVPGHALFPPTPLSRQDGEEVTSGGSRLQTLEKKEPKLFPIKSISALMSIPFLNPFGHDLTTNLNHTIE
ncbi:hypothetical protein TNCV_832521 [Trichonephila clavipes]|nr:hypothetical protein TNCV_832521 [Trichonephila clavipes]